MPPARELAYVALGSNVGARDAHLAAARARLSALPDTRLVAVSSIEETEPIGPPQPRYLNQMVLLSTGLAPRDLLNACREIEAAAGRVRQERWGPRTLDLDIVRYGDRIIDDPDLKVPHPELPRRGFWHRELAELDRHRTTASLPPWAHVTPERAQHIERVADLLRGWAADMNTPARERERWFRAAYFHDALKDAPPQLLESVARNPWGIAALRHGPAAAEMATRHGETDPGVLDAVRYHSVGYAGWDQVGRMLYLADFLEPGRGGAPKVREQLIASVPRDPRAALRRVARQRLTLMLARFHVLLPETVSFWNALACDVP